MTRGAARRIARAMRPVSATASIDVPRERLFDVLVDLAVRPSFMDHLVSDYRLERIESRGVGAAARFRLRESGGWMDTQIEAAERPRLVREQGRGGRLNRVPVFTVWELAEGPSPQSTELTVTFWTEPQHPADRVRELFGSSRHFAAGWRKSLHRLRDLIESGEPLEPVGVAGGDRLPALVH